MLNRIETLLAMYDKKQIDRRQLIGLLFAASVAPLAASQADQAGKPVPNPVFRGRNINHVTLRVDDIEEARAFYQELVGARVLLDGSKSTVIPPWYDLLLGDSFIAVMKGTPGIDHFAVGLEPWPGADSALEAVQKRFPGTKPTKSRNPLSKARSIDSVMVKDPSGNSVQLGSPTYQL
jgi:catechol 2,3-dioxygenase-like lactoylglutathione lyase family enzyme